MKDKIIWILIAIFVLVGLGVILFITSRSKEISNIKSMRLSYSGGWSAYAYTIYDLKEKDDGYYVEIKPYGVPDDEAQEVKLTEEQIKQIEEILTKYKVSKWNGFKKSDMNVLDGDSFSFYLHTEDGVDVSASGYMRWPENYKGVRSELYEILNPLYEYKENRVYE